MINERQNQPDCLELLYCQRFLYDQARFLWGVYFFVLATSVIISYCTAEHYKVFAGTFVTIMTIVNFFVEYYAKKNHSQAAEIQAEFDNRVYDLGTSNLQILLSDLEREQILMIANKKKRFVLNKKHLSECSLQNWYSDVSDVRRNTVAIYLCQLECIDWGTRLVKKFLNWNYALLFLLTIIIMLFFGTLKIGFLFNLLFTFPLFFCIVCLFRKLRSYKLKLDKIKMAEKLFELIIQNRDKDITMEDVTCLQEKINSFRKNSFLIPNWFYWLYRNDNQNIVSKLTANRIVQLKQYRPDLVVSHASRFIEV
ncbi:S-4TM family putative pore-forming effector [uncultured Victivallis sp.]|nr:S-4TM family putative pore-forming effector [uncultured Victivallis sp.]